MAGILERPGEIYIFSFSYTWVQKDRSLKLLDDLDMVMAQIIRESRIVRRDARKARKLMASGKTRRALKRISRIRNAEMDELLSYMNGIINQMFR